VPVRQLIGVHLVLGVVMIIHQTRLQGLVVLVQTRVVQVMIQAQHHFVQQSHGVVSVLEQAMIIARTKQVELVVLVVI